MDESEIEFILQEGEGLKIEFKESFDSKSLAKEIVAFANSEGGRIFWGVSDKGEIKGPYRKDIPEYPVEAVREAILNAVMHRDYFEKGANVQIDIFDDRMSVTNIGSLIKPLTKEKLGTLAIRRNPLIGDLFHRIHLVEKMGTGINRIREECRIHGNVGFEAETNGFFTAVFRLKKRRDEVTETTQKTTQKMIELIKENPNITRKELAEIVGISEDGIKFNLKKLKKRGLLKRIGPDKGGYWIVNEEGV